MSYSGYVPFLCEYTTLLYKKKQREIRILEIGVLQGTTTFSMATNLIHLQIPCHITGVDVYIRAEVKEQKLRTLGLNLTVSLVEENSLNYLKSRCEELALLDDTADTAHLKYDIILIDGDHNYSTVSQECDYIKDLIHPHTILLFDDVDSKKFGFTDAFYAEDPEYVDNSLATKTVSTDKKGVWSAVNEFAAANEDLQGLRLFDAPPRLYVHNENELFYEWCTGALDGSSPECKTDWKATIAAVETPDDMKWLPLDLSTCVRSSDLRGYPRMASWYAAQSRLGLHKRKD